MKPTFVFYAIQLGLTLINFGSVAASASDFNAPLAVSAINGEIELSGGVFDSDVKPSDEIF